MNIWIEQQRLARLFMKATGAFLAQTTGGTYMPDGRFYDVPPSFHGLDYLKMISGQYEHDERKILHRDFRPDHTLIEVGSNIGVVSRLAYETKLLPAGKMICVEANPASLSCLEINMGRSGMAAPGRSFEIVLAAMGMPRYEGEMADFLQCNTLCSALNSVAADRKQSQTIQVPVRSLSSLVGEHAPDGYSLICDAEGAEIPLLLDDVRALDTCRQIAIELHHPELTGSPLTPRDMIALFKDNGFDHRRQIADTHYFSRTAAMNLI